MTLDIRDLSADFYLRLNEGEGEPRACYCKRRVHVAGRDDWMLVAIEPPVIGQPYGLGGEDIYYLLLATRHQGQTLFPVSEWPAHVYAARLLINPIPDEPEFNATQTQLIHWGKLYRTYEDAVAR
ncbi:MAG: hypothetical protein ABSD13_08960 [Candidatus Korobacteraceae bacterium]|jgi:hypothetical protein